MDIKNLKILLVEDHRYMRQLVTATLKQFISMPILEAKNGYDGVIKLRNNWSDWGYTYADLVLCDLKMPVMDGFEFIEEVRKTSDIPIIILTGNADTENIKKAISLGIHGFVSKPVKHKILERQIIKAMSSQHIDLPNSP